MSPLTRYTLYTNPSLPCPQRVHLTIAELNISARFTFISVDLRNKPASLLSLSPSGAVPVLVEHNTTSNGNNEGADFVLNESRAIARYLVLMHGFRSQHAVEPEVGLARSKLIADETWERRDVARFEEAASVEVTGWDPVANKLVFEMAFKEIFGLGGRDVQLIERLWAELDRILDVLEGDRRRRRRKWVVGEEFSLVDIFYVPYMHHLVKIDRARIFGSRPVLEQWWAEVCSRDSYFKAFL